MGTMSYCCMQNTNADMKTCLEVMEKADSITDLSLDERRHARSLNEKCKVFMEEYERLIGDDKE